MSTTKASAGNTSSGGGLLAIGLIALIFGAGFASGWFVHRTTTPRASTPHKQYKQYKRGKRRRKPWRKRFMRRLTRKLALDKTQAQAIEAVISKHQPNYRKIKRSIRPALRKIRVQMRSEIKALLKPKQRTRFEAMIKAAKARRAARRKRRRQRTK